MNSLQGQTFNDTLLHNLLRDVNHFQLNFQMLFHIFLQTHFSSIFSLLKERKCFEGEIRQLAWKCCEVLCCSRGNSHTCWSYREKSVSSCVLQWMHRLIKLQWRGAAWAGVPHDYVNTAADPLKEVPLQSSQCHTGNSKEKQETFITADVLQ